MHVLQFEISKPTDDSAFEDMCARVYGEVFSDPLPKINGRKGQEQAGIDVFVSSASGRVGIQCKRYKDGTLKCKHVENEVRRAETAGTPIIRLIFATTAASDASLLREVQDYSDAREAEGKFTVEIEFWCDICRHIRGRAKLQNDYAPNAPGALFHRQDEQNIAIRAGLTHIESRLDMFMALPTGRSDSVDTFLTAQLDSVNDLIKVCRFRDANEDLARLGKNLDLFDVHQRARWYLQRGVCTWHLDSGKAAAPDFLKASELFPEDEKMAAAKVRGLLLQEDVAGAIEAGSRANDAFPGSVYVWLAYANARMVRGDELTLSDAPVSMREDCDVLQLLAWARKQAGDLAGAIELSQCALVHPDAGFFVRATALAIALESVLDDPLHVAYGFFGDNELRALRSAVAALEPRKERVWCVQSAESLADTLVHLGYAAIVLGRPEDALTLVDEAKLSGMLSARLIRVALDAYSKLNRHEELLRLGREWIHDLEEEALVRLAETASDVGDVDLVSAATDSAKKLEHSRPETHEILEAMRWVALWRSKHGQSLAVAEAKAAALSSSSSLAHICGGARVLFAAGEESEADAAITQACRLVTNESPACNRLMLADLLYSTRNYARAIPYYEQILDRVKCSELNVRLLSCYVRTGARHKAREIVQSLPDGWASDDQLRELALELGQLAADWSFLEPLAELQCARAPDAAGGWLLRLILDLKTKKMHRFHHTLQSLPGELIGGHRQLALVASLELRYGNKSAGMSRLYRLFRCHMDDLEAASAYFINIVSAPEDLPNMEETVSTVAAGTTVELQGEHGDTLCMSIDPQYYASLPPRDGFYSADCQDLVNLIGAVVGVDVELPGAFGTKRKYTVKSITSVYRYLLQMAQARFHTSLGGKGFVMSVPVPQTAAGMDFSHMHAMLKQKAEHSKLALDSYANGPLTLSILAKLLGRSVTELPGGWSSCGPFLFVCAGTQDERIVAAQLLRRKEAVYVMDAVTIAEIVNLGCEPILVAMPRILVSTKTHELLEARLEEGIADRSGGQVFDDEGVMRFVEYTNDDKRFQLQQLQAMVNIVKQHCEVLPAYGPSDIPQNFEAAERVLEDEEYSALLLATEHNATLFTVDGRLAQLAAATLGLTRVWPQAVIRYAAEIGLVSSRDYAHVTIKQFLGNRTFISLAPYDLVCMCLQGGQILRTGLQMFKEYLANPTTEFSSAASVVFDFIELQSKFPTQFKAFTELCSHMIEALLRHPECPTDLFIFLATKFANELLLDFARPEQAFPILESRRQLRIEVQSELLKKALQNAIVLSKMPVKRRAIKLKALMCTRFPQLMYDDEIPEFDAEIVTGDAPADENDFEHKKSLGTSAKAERTCLDSTDLQPDNPL